MKHLWIIVAVIAALYFLILRKPATAVQGTYSNVRFPHERKTWQHNHVDPVRRPRRWPVMIDSGNQQGPYRVGF